MRWRRLAAGWYVGRIDGAATSRYGVERHEYDDDEGRRRLAWWAVLHAADNAGALVDVLSEHRLMRDARAACEAHASTT